MVTEGEKKKNEAQAKVDALDAQLAEVFGRKAEAERAGDRKAFDKCRADIEWLGSQRKLREEEFQRVCHEVDAEIRAARLAEMEEHQTAADFNAARREIDALAKEASDFYAMAEDLRRKAIAVAAAQRKHAERVQELSTETGVFTTVPSLFDEEADVIFGNRVDHYMRQVGKPPTPLRGLDAYDLAPVNEETLREREYQQRVENMHLANAKEFFAKDQAQ